MSYTNKQKQKESQHKFYLANKAQVIQANRVRRAALKKWFREELTVNDVCKVCGEKDRSCIDYHHLDPKKKDMEIGTMLRSLRSRERILEEYAKCISLCANCHRKFHAGVISLPMLHSG